MAPLNLADFFTSKKIASMQEELDAVKEGICIVYGIGASLISPKPTLLLYADMPLLMQRRKLIWDYLAAWYQARNPRH